jgi:hypothetical protein
VGTSPGGSSGRAGASRSTATPSSWLSLQRHAAVGCSTATRQIQSIAWVQECRRTVVSLASMPVWPAHRLPHGRRHAR